MGNRTARVVRNSGCLLLLVCLSSTVRVAASPSVQYDDTEKLASTVVHLLVTTSTIPREGSGVIVNSEGVIFTAAHVVEGATEIQVELFDGFDEAPLPAYYARIQYISSLDGFDFAVLEIVADIQGNTILPSTLALPYVEAWSHVAVVRETIEIFGYLESADGVPHVTKGIIGSMPSRPIPIYQVDAIAGEGDSGSLVINSENEFIGIPIQWENDGGGYVATILPIGTICEIYPSACEYEPDESVFKPMPASTPELATKAPSVQVSTQYPPDPTQFYPGASFQISEEASIWGWICRGDLQLTSPSQIRLYDWGTNPITGEDAGRVGLIVVIPPGSHLTFEMPWGAFCEPNSGDQLENRLPFHIDVLLNNTSYQQCNGQGSINCDSAEIIWLSSDGNILDRRVFRDPYP